jgi:hypothetical protein
VSARCGDDRWTASQFCLASKLGQALTAARAALGPHKTGKGCLYLRRLADVDQQALRDLIDRSVRVRRGIDRASS